LKSEDNLHDEQVARDQTTGVSLHVIADAMIREKKKKELTQKGI